VSQGNLTMDYNIILLANYQKCLSLNLTNEKAVLWELWECLVFKGTLSRDGDLRQDLGVL
jgi:hypothetical protein